LTRENASENFCRINRTGFMLEKFSEAFSAEVLPCRNFLKHFPSKFCPAENFAGIKQGIGITITLL
jgi:hypothetical protein